MARHARALHNHLFHPKKATLGDCWLLGKARPGDVLGRLRALRNTPGHLKQGETAGLVTALFQGQGAPLGTCVHKDVREGRCFFL